jgi:hypothetical protein
MDVVIPYVHERKQFGQAIGDPVDAGSRRHVHHHQRCRAYVYAVGKALDRGDLKEPVRVDAAGAILTLPRKLIGAGEAIQALAEWAISTRLRPVVCGATEAVRDRRRHV